MFFCQGARLDTIKFERRTLKQERFPRRLASSAWPVAEKTERENVTRLSKTTSIINMGRSPQHPTTIPNILQAHKNMRKLRKLMENISNMMKDARKTKTIKNYVQTQIFKCNIHIFRLRKWCKVHQLFYSLFYCIFPNC